MRPTSLLLVVASLSGTVAACTAEPPPEDGIGTQAAKVQGAPADPAKAAPPIEPGRPAPAPAPAPTTVAVPAPNAAEPPAPPPRPADPVPATPTVTATCGTADDCDAIAPGGPVVRVSSTSGAAPLVVRFGQVNLTSWFYDAIDLGDGSALTNASVASLPLYCTCVLWTHTYAAGEYDVRYRLNGQDSGPPPVHITAN